MDQMRKGDGWARGTASRESEPTVELITLGLGDGDGIGIGIPRWVWGGDLGHFDVP